MVYGVRNGHYSVFHDNNERNHWKSIFPDAKNALAKDAWKNTNDLWVPLYETDGTMLGMWKVAKDPTTGKVTDYSLTSQSYIQLRSEMKIA